jgi:AraC-like DNA-binding protein
MISKEIIMTIATVDSAMNLYPVTADHCLVYFFSDKIQLSKLDIAFITDFALITTATANWKIAPVFAPVTVVTLNMPISELKNMIAHPETYFTENEGFIFLPNLLSNKKLEVFPALFLNQNLVPVTRLRMLKEELLIELQTALRSRFETKQIPAAPTAKAEPLAVDVAFSNHAVLKLIHEKYFSSFLHLPPHVSEIAAEMNMTVPNLQYLFKSHFGKTFYQVYLDRKMEYAVKLLEKGLRSSNISKIMGYAAPIKFNKQFKKHFGVTPFQYNKNNFENSPRQAI